MNSEWTKFKMTNVLHYQIIIKLNASRLHNVKTDKNNVKKVNTHTRSSFTSGCNFNSSTNDLKKSERSTCLGATHNVSMSAPEKSAKHKHQLLDTPPIYPTQKTCRKCCHTNGNQDNFISLTTVSHSRKTTTSTSRQRA